MWRGVPRNQVSGLPLVSRGDTVNHLNLKALSTGGAEVDFIVVLGAVASVGLLAPITDVETAIAALLSVAAGLWLTARVLRLVMRLVASCERAARNVIRGFRSHRSLVHLAQFPGKAKCVRTS